MNMVEEIDSDFASTKEYEGESSFRKRYAQELRSKKQQIDGSYQGHNELEDERKKVNQQMIRTPGRRGEIIKEEEISKEIIRRYKENQENNST